MKKTITLILAASALALALGATACNTGGTALGGNSETPASSESVYGVSAATAGMLIQSMEASLPQPTGSAKESPATTAVTMKDDTQEMPAADGADLSELDGYMQLVDSFLNGSAFTVREEASDRSEYEEKMTVSYKGIGGTDEYVMYFNKTLIPDDDFDDHDDWDDRWEDEQEEEYAIRGVLVIEGNEYPVQGVRDIERERDEYESETEFRVTLSGGRTVWVEQSESSEEGEYELEYSYSIRENGRVVERSAFSFEEEGREHELEMITEKDGRRQVFYFEKDSYRGREYIFLRLGSGRDFQSYRVEPDGNGGYTYEPIGR